MRLSDGWMYDWMIGWITRHKWVNKCLHVNKGLRSFYILLFHLFLLIEYTARKAVGISEKNSYIAILNVQCCNIILIKKLKCKENVSMQTLQLVVIIKKNCNCYFSYRFPCICLLFFIFFPGHFIGIFQVTRIIS